MERLTIDIGAIVQHFKRKEWAENASNEEAMKEPFMFLYKIEGVAYDATNSHSGEIMIVYRALYGQGTLYTRSIKEFLQNVDEEKYGQGFRFVRYEGNITLPEF